MANKINIITGENYTLAELFSEERQIIIPDLQRDYCWGNNNNTKVSGKGELVSDFVNNLIDQFKSKDKESLNLGLLYGYEIPANHIQLCDGQQRITTLFLLLGMINKRTGAFRQHLISDFEYEHDDKEPYLKYAIRESSLYFLSDLVCNFFISNTDPVDKIKTADWYFQDYDLDPSIQSMIKTLEIIETLLTKTAENIDLKEFGDWLLHKLTFMYVDMENRQNGEDERVGYAVHGIYDFLKIAGGVKFPADEHSGGGNRRNGQEHGEFCGFAAFHSQKASHCDGYAGTAGSGN